VEGLQQRMTDQILQGFQGIWVALGTDAPARAAAPPSATVAHRATARFVLTLLVHVITPRVIPPFRGLTGMTGDGSEPPVPQRLPNRSWTAGLSSVPIVRACLICGNPS
jgi:hypothetical protein